MFSSSLQLFSLFVLLLITTDLSNAHGKGKSAGIIQQGQRSKREIEDTIPKEREMRWSRCLQSNQTIYDSGFKIEDLEGNQLDLNRFKGKMLLIVNVATFCAYTEHYLDFGPLLEKYKDLRILAFPSNQFGLQEPGKNKEILNGIRYVRPGNNYILPKNAQIMAKIEVNGQNEHPFFNMLKSMCPATVRDIGKHEQLFYSPIRVNDITWNFEKFLIDKEGMPRFRFHPTAWNKGNMLGQFLNELSTGERVRMRGGNVMLPEIIQNENNDELESDQNEEEIDQNNTTVDGGEDDRDEESSDQNNATAAEQKSNHGEGIRHGFYSKMLTFIAVCAILI